VNSAAAEYAATIRDQDGEFTVSLVRLTPQGLLCEYSVESEDVARSHLTYILAKMNIPLQKVDISPTLRPSVEGA
jgi:hypothetical protein